jgi:hypothetical protein
MELDPEELREMFDATFAEWKRDADTAPLPVYFPDEVIESLKTLGPPSWDLVWATSETVHKDGRLEEAFAQDLARLCRDEESLRWAA